MTKTLRALLLAASALLPFSAQAASPTYDALHVNGNATVGSLTTTGAAAVNSLSVTGATGVGSWTSAGRPAVSVPTIGFNTTLQNYDFYLGGSWVNFPTLVNGLIPAAQMPALTGDTTMPAGTTVTTTSKVNGVTFPALPSTNTVPVITAANTVTYEALPASAMAVGAAVANIGYTPLNKAGDTMVGALHMGANTLDGSAIAFTGGSLNGVAIGGTTPAAVAATTLSASGTSTLSALLHMAQPASIQFDGSRTWSGTQGAIGNAEIYSYTNQSGSTTTGNPVAFHYFAVASDTVQSSIAAANLRADLTVQTGATGGRNDVMGQLTIGGTPGDGSQFTAGFFPFQAQAPANAAGNIGYGTNPTCGLNGTATGAWQCVGEEIDVAARSGSTPVQMTGLSVVTVNGHVQHGSNNLDTAVAIGNQSGTTTGWDYGLRFGGPSNPFPFVSTATLIYSYPATSGLTITNGVDFSHNTFTGYSWNDGHVKFDGSGNITTSGTLSATGGINSTPIGATTPSTGAFTTLSATGQSTFGAVSGSSFATPNNAVAGGTPTYFLGLTSHISNAITANGNVGWNGITVNNDTATDSGSTPNVADLIFNHNFGGTGFSGGRSAIVSQFTQNGAIANDLTINGITDVIKVGGAVGYNFGGTNLNTGAHGALNGYNPVLHFQNYATNMIGGSGIEVDSDFQTGSSLKHFTAVAAVHLAASTVSPTEADIAFQAGNQVNAAATMTAALEVGGREGWWPLASSNGEVLRLELSNNYNSSPSTLYRGVDLLLGNISGAAFTSQGFRVDGQTGEVRSGTCYLTPGSTGATLGCPGSIGTAVAVAAGGSSWPTDGNTYYATDAYGGVYTLTLTGGAVTGVAIYRAPYVNGATPANPVALTPDPLAATWGATGLTVNLTWAARSKLAIGGSGQTVAITGFPTSCTGQASGTLYNNAGTPAFCP